MQELWRGRSIGGSSFVQHVHSSDPTVSHSRCGFRQMVRHLGDGASGQTAGCSAKTRRAAFILGRSVLYHFRSSQPPSLSFPLYTIRTTVIEGKACGYEISGYRLETGEAFSKSQFKTLYNSLNYLAKSEELRPMDWRHNLSPLVPIGQFCQIVPNQM